MTPRLPVDAVLDDVDRHFREATRLVLQAEPGAGKSTRVPLHLLNAPWLEGRRIVMLEPRRIAARNLAAYLAEQLGEQLGETVGLQIRDERVVGPRTRLEIITEGILTRRLQSDPEAEGIGLVIFDEFHERHVQSDLALALALDVQRNLREDLRLLVMSATIDADTLGRWLHASALRCAGRQHPVTIEHRATGKRRPAPAQTAAAVRDTLARTDGDVLVFLPGRREIEQTAAQLAAGAEIRPLYGALPLTEQRRALAPGSGRRVVLATNIAESSLTVPGVTAVVDSGLEKAPVFDPASGLTKLVTQRISAASADQRAGRAGRLGPGLAIRLWSPSDRLEPATRPEILRTDLAGLVLEIKAWGGAPAEMAWLDAPPEGAWSQAEDLLLLLGALDAQTRRVTARGRRFLRWGTEPRLAALLESADDQLALACELVALLDGRDPLPGGDDDLRSRWQAWRQGRLPGGVSRRLDREAALWRKRAGRAGASRAAESAIGPLLAEAYPDRIARRRAGDQDRYQMVNGRGVHLRPDSALAGHEWLVICEAALQTGDSPVQMACPIDGRVVRERFGDRIVESSQVFWDDDAGRVVAERRQRLGQLTLGRKDWPDPPPEQVGQALLGGLRTAGIDALGWSRPATSLRQRMAFLHHHFPEQWPDWSDEALLSALDDWLGPYLAGRRTLAAVRELDLKSVLLNRLDWPDRQEADRLAPERVDVPSGRTASVDYSDPEQPVLAVKLQEMFGCAQTPRVAGGAVALTLHLLSPAGRPLQITRDLAHFWAHVYPEVRKEMRGRYPKHPWPEDPLAAEPTARTKRQPK